jgi:ribosomal protein L11 methyltransferase
MSYMQLSVLVDAERCSALEPVLETLGALAITYADPGGAPVLEPAVGANPLWDRVRLIALFEPGAEVDTIVDALRGALPAGELAGLAFEQLAEREWERAWMDDFRPMKFGQRLWVCPTTAEPPQPEAINLRLDPGLAFGTGTHPTTALCLGWLERSVYPGARTVDYGCGSGILAVASLLLGGADCVAVDNDPQALLATRENARRNGVEQRLRAVSPEQDPLEAVDILVANILAGVLIELAPHLQSRVVHNGRIALSGILQEQAAAVAAAYEPWFALEQPENLDGWVLLHGRKR